MFFLVVIFFGSFYLMNLMLAVVALSYEEVTEVSSQVGQVSQLQPQPCWLLSWSTFRKT